MGLKDSVRQRMEGGDPPQGDPWELPLRLVSVVYGLGVSIRSKAYDMGVRHIRRLPAPVISVGNLCVGGTGKTPLVMALARCLKAVGQRVCILSRGYGRKEPSRLIRSISLGKGPICSVREAGDEPYMMARRLNGVSVWVGSNRYKAGLRAWQTQHPHLFVLDDGFQHRRLHRDLDILVVRAERPLGNGHLLPAGSLREPPEAVKRAHLIVINAAASPSAKRGGASLGSLLASDVPIIRMTYRPASIWRLTDGGSVPLGELKGIRVAALCGVGDPRGFVKLLEALGAEVEEILSFQDHCWYTPPDLRRIREALRRVDAGVTTEKDAWKLRDAGLWDERVWVLQVEAELEPMELVWRRLRPFLASS